MSKAVGVHPQSSSLCSACAVACRLGNVSLLAHVANFGAQGLLLALCGPQLAGDILQHLLHMPQLCHCPGMLLQTQDAVA